MSNTNLFTQFVNDWQNEFTDRIEQEIRSRKQVFTLKDAIDKSTTKNRRSSFDSVMISYSQYIEKNPLNKNDYYKYLNSYSNGKKLSDKYFKHDKGLLDELYKKIDENPKYNPFSLDSWQMYVLFMLLKFKGLYKPSTMDEVFNVKVKDNREYNPITKLSRPLRGMLPSSLKLVQWDISRAYPTFIDMELNIKRKEDVYSLIDKRKFNMLLNTHKDCKNADIEAIRSELKPVYGSRVDEVITAERFNNKGQLFEDLSKYEKKYIDKFVEANNLKKYVRLHDAVFVLADEQIKETEFDEVIFKSSKVQPPETVNNNKLFYEVDEKNKIITSPVSYKDFFEQENFIRVTVKGEDTITILKDTNNVVKPFNHKTDTVSFLKNKINEYDHKPVENKIAKDNNRDIKESFCLLDAIPLVYYRDSSDVFGVPFKNGFVYYKKGSKAFNVKPYKEVNGFFPEHPTQQKEFEFIESPEPSIFERFLSLVSTAKDPLKETLTNDENETRLLFNRMFGYLLHTYKDPSFSPSIILSDHGANDKSRNGRRGKSLIGNAVKAVQKTIIKGGNEFDGGYRHRFADLDESVKNYVIDDVLAGFKYDDLYTNIVGGISVEPKGQKARIIDFKQAPKFIVTTNWAIRYDEEASSTNARFMEFKFTDFFNINHTPKKYFGHRFFEDWNDEQWNEFYNFCFNCVGYYLEFGLEAPNYNKTADNYRAYFYNDTLETEFERIFNLVKEDRVEGFNVSRFLEAYQDFNNSLRYEKFFNHKNTKTLINVYLKHHNIKHSYREDLKKWFVY